MSIVEEFDLSIKTLNEIFTRKKPKKTQTFR